MERRPKHYRGPQQAENPLEQIIINYANAVRDPENRYITVPNVPKDSGEVTKYLKRHMKPAMIARLQAIKGKLLEHNTIITNVSSVEDPEITAIRIDFTYMNYWGPNKHVNKIGFAYPCVLDAGARLAKHYYAPSLTDKKYPFYSLLMSASDPNGTVHKAMGGQDLDENVYGQIAEFAGVRSEEDRRFLRPGPRAVIAQRHVPEHKERAYIPFSLAPRRRHEGPIGPGMQFGPLPPINRHARTFEEAKLEDAEAGLQSPTKERRLNE